MKIAVCVSGLCGDKALENVEKMKNIFPYDFYCGVWSGRKSDMSEQLGAVPFEEHVPKYHPYLDIDDCNIPKFIQIREGLPKEKRLTTLKEKSLHHTKQILAHAHLLKTIPDEYDMIIRTRYDVLISDKVDFESYISYAYDNNSAVGFGLPFKRKPIDVVSEAEGRLWEGYLMDILIIHPTSLFNVDRVFELHEKQKLRAAEWGWYQILSEPYNDNHRCIFGGVKVDRGV